MKIITNCRLYFDVKLPITLWSDHVRRFEKKLAECDNIFLAKFPSQIHSLHLSLSYVSILSVFLFFLCVYLLPVMVNKDVYIRTGPVFPEIKRMCKYELTTTSHSKVII